MSLVSSRRPSLDYKNYAFDLDGTLVDSLPVHAKCFKYVLEQFLPAALEHFDYSRFLGWKTIDVFRALNLHEDGQIAKLTAAKQACYQEAVKHGQVRPFAGVMETLQLLRNKGRSLYVITGGTRRSTLEILETCGFAKYFSGVVCGEDVHASKPDPEPFLYALSHFGLRNQDVLTVEDSASGAVASEQAGICAVMVNTSNPDCDRLCFRAFTDLLQALRNSLCNEVT